MQGLKSDNKLDIVETLSVIGSIGGAIASVVFQQIALASIPLSVSVALNLLNRRRLLDASSQSNQSAIAQIVQENFKTQEQVGTQASQLTQLQQLTTKKSGETQEQVGTLTQQLAQLQQLSTDLGQSQNNHNLAITQVRQENVETQAKFETLTQQLAELQQLTTNLVPNQGNKNLNEYTQNLLNEQAKLAKTVDCLREIETCSQTIRSNPNHATAYYNRGLSYERLGEQEAAIGDYSAAIRLNPNYVEAYNSRGLAYVELGNKKGAVNDLRTAAKLFFEQGDIANYQIAKDLGKQLYQIDSQPQTDVFSGVAVERLFA